MANPTHTTNFMKSLKVIPDEKQFSPRERRVKKQIPVSFKS
jgi:hypothetical protein